MGRRAITSSPLRVLPMLIKPNASKLSGGCNLLHFKIKLCVCWVAFIYIPFDHDLPWVTKDKYLWWHRKWVFLVLMLGLEIRLLTADLPWRIPKKFKLLMSCLENLSNMWKHSRKPCSKRTTAMLKKNKQTWFMICFWRLGRFILVFSLNTLKSESFGHLLWKSA